MSRDKIAANQHIFQQFRATVSEKRPDLSHLLKTGARWIDTEVGDENLESYVRLSRFILGPFDLAQGLTVSLLKYTVSDGMPEFFFAITGALGSEIVGQTDVCDGDSVLLRPVNADNPGVFVAAASEDGLVLSDIHESDVPALVELIGERVGKFSVQEVSPYWLGGVYQVVDDRLIECCSSHAKETAIRCAGLMIASLDSEPPIQGRTSVPRVSNYVNQQYVNALLREGWEYYGPLMVSSMLSHSRGHRFLDVYRCFERLFSVRRVMDLLEELDGDSWSIGGPSADLLADEILQHLGWKPNEIGTLTVLIGNLPQSVRKRLVDSLRPFSTWDPGEEVTHSSAAGLVYSIRNGLAHYREGPSELQNPAIADPLLSCIIESVVSSYNDCLGGLRGTPAGSVIGAFCSTG